MPILWRYLLRAYFQTFLLCVGAFIGVLIVLRFQEIARFATSGAPKLTTLLFALLQIPYILPIAIPVSCLIATLLLFQRLSYTHELTALRTCGLGLKSVTTPLLYAGFFLTLVNFTIASELSPPCKSLSQQLIFEVVSSNPLFILQRDSLVKLKSAYYNIGTLKDNTHAEDVLFVIKNSSTGRMTLMCAKELKIEADFLTGKQVAFISSVDSKRQTPGFDHLIIENQTEMQTKSADLSQFLQTVDWKANYEYLPIRGILANGYVKGDTLSLNKGAQIEIFRRISIGLAALTFTVVGLGFGIYIGRNSSKKKLFAAIGLTAAFLACFIAAKSFQASSMTAILIFLLPHPVILLCSLYSLSRVRRGIE